MGTRRHPSLKKRKKKKRKGYSDRSSDDGNDHNNNCILIIISIITTTTPTIIIILSRLFEIFEVSTSSDNVHLRRSRCYPKSALKLTLVSTIM